MIIMEREKGQNELGEWLARMALAGILFGLAWGFGQAGQQILSQLPPRPPPPRLSPPK